MAVETGDTSKGVRIRGGHGRLVRCNMTLTAQNGQIGWRETHRIRDIIRIGIFDMDFPARVTINARHMQGALRSRLKHHSMGGAGKREIVVFMAVQAGL